MAARLGAPVAVVPGAVHSPAAQQPAATVEALLAALEGVAGTRVKNLFIKAKKEKAPGDSKLWLVCAAHDTDTNLVKLAAKLGYGKIVLRFAEADALLENLGARQGNVSPLLLANDAARVVNVALDARLLAPAAAPLLLHPGANEATAAVQPQDLLKFIEATGHAVTVIDFAAP
jgi:Ala-tRNA(Pro) deacylase